LLAADVIEKAKASDSQSTIELLHRFESSPRGARAA